MTLDLDTIRPWLEPCGNCDAGLRVNCTHPDGDYRTPMAALVAEVERLRAALQVIADHDYEFVTLTDEQRADADACPECKRAQEMRWPPSGTCDRYYRDLLRAEKATAQNRDFEAVELRHIARAALRASAETDGTP